MAYWLLKTEPGEYSYEDLEKAGRDCWDGVTNATALIHLRNMRPGDEAVIYHTGDERRAVGLAQIVSEPYPDPGAENNAAGKIVAVDVAPVRRLSEPIGLAALKDHPSFADSPLVRISRLSVVPLTEEQFRIIAG
jgi:predicted RNA-binding protein with PUA-like domain